MGYEIGEFISSGFSLMAWTYFPVSSVMIAIGFFVDAQAHFGANHREYVGPFFVQLGLLLSAVDEF